MRTINKIIDNVSCKYGAPMGRPSTGKKRFDKELQADVPDTDKKVFDCRVPMGAEGAYDKGGAYWGLGAELRVSYTKDLTYVNFYRKTK